MEHLGRGFRLSTKALFMMIVFLVVFAGTSLTSVIMSQSMKSQVTKMNQQDIKINKIADELHIAFYEMDDNVSFLVGMGAHPDKNIAKQEYDAIHAGMDHLINAWSQLNDPSLQLSSSESGIVNKMRKQSQDYLGLATTILNTDLTNYQVAHSIEYGVTLSKNFFDFTGNATDLGNLASKNEVNIQQQIDSQSSTQIFVSEICLVIGILLGIGIILYIRRAIKPLQYLADSVTEIAEGNFTGDDIEVKSRDEIGQLARATNYMKHNLSALIRQVADSSNMVAAASEELSSSADETSRATEHISQTVQEVAIGAEQQAASTVDSADSIKEMSTGIQQIATSTVTVKCF